jgi:hypothetical protein
MDKFQFTFLYCDMKSKIFTLFSALTFLLIQVQAQDAPTDAPVRKKRWSYNSGIESSILQFSQITTGGTAFSTIPRYTYFFNTGVDINYHVSNNLRPFTGIHLKNLGLIIRTSDSTKSKHRVYTLGAPIGIKYVSNNKKLTLKAGADVAYAFNYRWKYFVNDTKTKGNEFFSDKTSTIFSSAFLGITVGGVSVTGNVFLNDFFNQAKVGLFGINARLYTVSLGLNLDENTFKFKPNK